MKQLKFLIPLIALCLIIGTGKASAQWTVIDPSNIAQSIVNNSKSLRTGVADGDAHGEEFSGNREDLSAGEEVL